MTIPNRTVSITGVFAENALTTIPATPIPGTSYRDTAMTSTAIREGWAFKTIVDSAQFNQALYEYSSVTSQVEKYGFLPWSSLTDYVQGSVCLGSNGMLYQAKQATGPSSTAVDPTTDSSVWQQVILGNTNWLFKHEWSDYEITRQDWLRADTFSWQPGTIYTEAYNHLVDDIDGITPTTETIGSYTITYYPCSDGHKVVAADQENTVLNIYNESGVAWYYILDTANQRFKLPRTKYDFVGLRDEVGKYVPESVPDIFFYGTPQNMSYGYVGGQSLTSSGIVHASTISSAYQPGAPVQQRATQQYLYFYIGQFSQSATEQTAGLNASLFNGKVDLNAANLSDAGKSLIAGLGMPSYTYDDLTLGATETLYTAPSDGFVCCTRVQQANGLSWTILCVLKEGETTVSDATQEYRVGASGTVSGDAHEAFLPVKKGRVFSVGYGGASASLRCFRFIYAVGSESEAS